MALEGKLVTLRERRPSDAAFLASLRNDLETQAWSKTLPADYTEEMVLKYDQSREFSFDRFEGRFMIEVKETGEAAGTCSYSQLQPRFSAAIGWAVGKAFWGKGIARDANEVLIRFMFEELGLRVIRLHTHSGNPRAVGMAEKCGFRVSVRMHEAIFKGGQLYDNILMDILREEYYALHPELTDNLPTL